MLISGQLIDLHTLIFIKYVLFPFWYDQYHRFPIPTVTVSIFQYIRISIYNSYSALHTYILVKQWNSPRIQHIGRWTAESHVLATSSIYRVCCVEFPNSELSAHDQPLQQDAVSICGLCSNSFQWGCGWHFSLFNCSCCCGTCVNCSSICDCSCAHSF